MASGESEASRSSSTKPPAKGSGGFRKFFTRGLAILLPTVLTIWLIVIAYNFMNDRIGQPINTLIKIAIIQFSDRPTPVQDDYDLVYDALNNATQRQWEKTRSDLVNDPFRTFTEDEILIKRAQWMRQQPALQAEARAVALNRLWTTPRLGEWVVTDLIGLLLAIVLVYFAGVFLSNFLGRRLYAKGEELINRVPLVGKVYPAFKQITDFFFAEKDSPIDFNRVVAVQYPRKGLWSVGLVTGQTMRQIQDEAGQDCLTVFVPSSPTPFTGYVITVPIGDTVDLNVTIEDALKFAVSGGVVIPTSQIIGQPLSDDGLPAGGSASRPTPVTLSPGSLPSQPRQDPT